MWYCSDNVIFNVSSYFMAIFTLCVTQENVDYKPIHEANTLILKSVPTFYFNLACSWNTVFIIGVVLVLEKRIFLSTIFRWFVVKTFFFSIWKVVSTEDYVRIKPESRGYLVFMLLISRKIGSFHCSWCLRVLSNIHSKIEAVMNWWTEINLRDIRDYLVKRSQRAFLMHADFNQWVGLHRVLSRIFMKLRPSSLGKNAVIND